MSDKASPTSRMKRPHLTAWHFREIMDNRLGLDAAGMAKLLGLKDGSGARTVERFRNGDMEIPGTIATILWFAVETGQRPPWASDTET